MARLFHIFKFKLRTLVILSTDMSAATVMKHSASVLVFGVFAVGAYGAAHIATEYILDTARMGLFLLHRFLSMLLFVFFLSINVGNIIVSYASFYRSQEMTYYLTKPLAHTHLFIMKFFDNFFYSSGVFLLVAIAVLLGYGSYFHMTAVFYLRTMLLMLMPFMLVSGCSAAIMLIVLMRFADRIGVRKVIIILVLAYLGALYAYFSVTNPVALVSQVMVHFPNVDQYFGNLDPPAVKFLPNHWIAESLYWTMRGDDSFALSYAMMMVLFAAGVFALMVFIAKKLFYKSWLSSLQLQVADRPGMRFLQRLSLTSPPFFSDRQTGVLLKKEFWVFVREPSQWIHLGIIMMLIATFVESVAHINLKQSLPFLQTLSYMVIFLFNAFLIASIALRFVYPSISIEGPNFWSVLSAPVDRRKIFWLKLFIPLVPILLASDLLIVVSHLSLMHYPVLLISAILVMTCVTFALVSLNLGAGAYFTDFKEKNPIRVASSQGATLTFLVSIAYLTVLVAILFIPFSNYFSYILRDVPLNIISFTVSIASAILFSLCIGGISLVVGKRSLRRDY